ncbi:hypothetical protein REPUB_Repub08aG0021600 [Reevesia pubescens]
MGKKVGAEKDEGDLCIRLLQKKLINFFNKDDLRKELEMDLVATYHWEKFSTGAEQNDSAPRCLHREVLNNPIQLDKSSTSCSNNL